MSERSVLITAIAPVPLQGPCCKVRRGEILQPRITSWKSNRFPPAIRRRPEQPSFAHWGGTARKLSECRRLLTCVGYCHDQSSPCARSPCCRGPLAVARPCQCRAPTQRDPRRSGQAICRRGNGGHL